MASPIHVVQGYTAAGCFQQAMHPEPGHLLVNDDVLSCGPLPVFQSPEQWTRVRGAYWDSVAPDSRPTAEFNREFLTGALSLRDTDSLVLWLGVGVAEQLLLAWTVHLLKFSGCRAQISIVQFTRAGRHDMDVWGLGLLKPELIARHPPIEPLSTAAISELERFWAAATSADPTKLLSMLSDTATGLPHCRSSLRHMILRYPDHITGLGRWDFELLKYTREKGPTVTRVIGHLMGNNFDADMVGDAVLFARLRRLGAADVAQPLVSLPGDSTHMRRCEVVLTEAGESVLAGRANAIELNGIDDWVLGVHLDSKHGTVWCRKDGELYEAYRTAGHADGEPRG
jgi:hypothetical protein